MRDTLQPIRDFEGAEREIARGVRVRDRLREIPWPFTAVLDVRSVVLCPIRRQVQYDAIKQGVGAAAGFNQDQAKAIRQAVERSEILCAALFHAPPDDAAPLRPLFASAEALRAQIDAEQIDLLLEAHETFNAHLRAGYLKELERGDHHADA